MGVMASPKKFLKFFELGQLPSGWKAAENEVVFRKEEWRKCGGSLGGCET